ncbi:MAG: nicotinamide-nucleotide amidase [Frankiaceae bacterium]|jgi:PncC family amidohydrolase|nr:nicotinamide-nucleotide amidase [Frankiaceae bacterium]
MTGEAIDVVVHGLLAQRGATLAVAESLTGGLLGAALTDMPGASRTFRGGVLAYATELKESMLGVPGPLLAAEGPVSAQVAAAMAAGVRDRLDATYGVALTGVAGPDPQGGYAPGTVFIGIAGPDDGQVRELTLVGDRAAIRREAVRSALDFLRVVLTDTAAV